MSKELEAEEDPEFLRRCDPDSTWRLEQWLIDRFDPSLVGECWSAYEGDVTTEEGRRGWLRDAVPSYLRKFYDEYRKTDDWAIRDRIAEQLPFRARPPENGLKQHLREVVDIWRPATKAEVAQALGRCLDALGQTVSPATAKFIVDEMRAVTGRQNCGLGAAVVRAIMTDVALHEKGRIRPADCFERVEVARRRLSHAVEVHDLAAEALRALEGEEGACRT